MKKEIEERNVDPSIICVQIPEQEAAKYIKPVQNAAEALRKIGVSFALEHYGIPRPATSR